MPGLAAALRAGDLGLAAFRFDHLDWAGGDMTVVDKGTAAGAPGGNRVAAPCRRGQDRSGARRRRRAA